MTLYRVNYVNLRTGRHETETLASGLQFNHIDGVQRGMVVLRDACTDEIERAYEVFAYFHRYDKTGSPVQFKRGEEITDANAVREKLKRNKGVEVLANVNSDLTVPLFERPKTVMPQPNVEGTVRKISLERHLMEQHGAFSRALKRRTKIIKNPGK